MIERTVIIIALILLAGSLSCQDSDVAKVNRRIKSAFPLNSSYQRVITVLDSLKIEHSQYDPTAHTIKAIIRETSRGAMVIESVQIVFVFDSLGNLQSHKIKQGFTGS